MFYLYKVHVGPTIFIVPQDYKKTREPPIKHGEHCMPPPLFYPTPLHAINNERSLISHYIYRFVNFAQRTCPCNLLLFRKACVTDKGNAIFQS